MPDNLGAVGASKLPLPIRHRPSKMSSPNKPRRQQQQQRTPNTTTPRRSLSQPPKAPDHDDNDNQADTTNDPSTARTPITNPNNHNFRASAPPAANARYSIRTPGSQAGGDFRSSRHLVLSASARRAGGAPYAVPTQFTPHGRAAIRALDLRRAAINDINTPGRNRRRSMRDQRETPRDVLRALSKTLAPTSKPISTSSSSSPDDPSNNSSRRRRSRGASGRSRSRGRRAAVVIPEDPDDDDDSDEFPIDRPRFSLPIDEDADSDGDLPRPPRSSGLEDLEDNYTMQSIEMPRRATLGQQPPRYSIRMSDYGPLNDPQSDNDDDGGAFFPRLNWADDAGDDDGTGVGGGEGEDATIERLDDDEAARRDTLGGRISDFGAIDFNLEAADQSTVVLAPQVESSPARRGELSSPARQDFSPENEPFGFDDGPPPPLADDADDDEEMDLGGGGGETLLDMTAIDDDEDIGNDGATDLSTGTVVIRQASRAGEAAGRVRKPGKKVSRHGIQYPSLPTSTVKRLAQRFAGKAKIGPDTLSAIMQASDWFFEQLGDDLEAYAHHANRETINESDMLTLMRR